MKEGGVFTTPPFAMAAPLSGTEGDTTRRLLITADEDFCKSSGSGIEKGFGYMRIYEWRNGSPRQIGSYRTPNSLGTNDQAAGDFVVHNNWLVGTDVYASWYTDGVRVIDTSNPSAPREVAYFVPPATPNPIKPSQRGVLTTRHRSGVSWSTRPRV